MKKLFGLVGLITIGLIFWTALGYLLDMKTFPIVLPICIVSIVIYFITGFLKNHRENKEFREFLASRERDKEVQEKLKHERIEPGVKTGRARVNTSFKERNNGLNWTAASVHGAVATRKKRRTFLSKNR